MEMNRITIEDGFSSLLMDYELKKAYTTIQSITIMTTNTLLRSLNYYVMGQTMIPIIILAAGMSTRFPGNKLLYKVFGEPLIRTIVKSALRSKADKVIVITGFEADKISKVLEDLDIDIIYNENYNKGMSFSVKKSINCVRGIANAAIIHPADVAFVPSEVFNRVIDYYLKTKAKIVIAGYRGIKGHPILFDSSLFNEIMEISEETMGLKAIVNKYKDKAVIVETNSEEVLLDIDTLEDLINYLNRKHIR